MICKKCGMKADENDRFCQSCGSRLEKENNPLEKQREREAELVKRTETRPVKNQRSHSIYIVDFFSRLFQVSNIGIIIYMIMNIVIISLFVAAMIEMPTAKGFAIGFVVYLISVCIALSPFGEFLLRKMTHVEKIRNQKIAERMYPIFNEVYAKARALDPSISEDVQLFILNVPEENAFAMGRKSVTFTAGLLNEPDDVIRGVLAHEFGHLSNKDTDRLLIISIGNMLITGVATVLKILVEICDFMIKVLSVISIFGGEGGGLLTYMFSGLAKLCTILIINVTLNIWTGIGMLFCRKTSRENEFQADAFAAELGYGKALTGFLESIGPEYPSGMIARLMCSHPDNPSRISNINETMIAA